ncbi:mannose-1-phosphate guanylyltransferase [Poriferisphaera sp. WC338]|uniref:mannose-1-phosphate guanylyltransferase n=1 Tax=Poriferisphaera sp. WC338 TaxID=3425129 RepID=UPI003D813160
MKHALIIAGGSGTRLWPMSTKDRPKQLIPLIDGKSLLEISVDRLRNLVGEDHIYICAGESMRDLILQTIPGMSPNRFIAEPMGRDTLNAVALGTGVIAKHDPDATVGIFTADHLIEPVDDFARIVEQGYNLAERRNDLLVTFGVSPTHPATGFGYLELADAIEGNEGAKKVANFKEKPDTATAQTYLVAGPTKYLWNAGMFVWQATTLMACVQKFCPENAAAIDRVLAAWGTPEQQTVLHEVYPTLKKISVDYAIMEPASTDDRFGVASVPMPIQWLDVGSWPSLKKTLTPDPAGNAATGCKSQHLKSNNILAVSEDTDHLITTIGCDDLIIIHTDKATLVCHKDHAETIKQLHTDVGETYGQNYL